MFFRVRAPKNIGILKKFDGTNSVEFDSVRYSRKFLEFHCISIKGKNSSKLYPYSNFGTIYQISLQVAAHNTYDFEL